MKKLSKKESKKTNGGSTRITIRAQAFDKKADPPHTLQAEFIPVNGTLKRIIPVNGTLERTSRN